METLSSRRDIHVIMYALHVFSTAPSLRMVHPRRIPTPLTASHNADNWNSNIRGISKATAAVPRHVAPRMQVFQEQTP